MSSKEQKHDSDKASSKQRSPKPAIDNLDVLAQQQTHAALIVQRVGIGSSSLTPGEVQQLQRTIGNEAVVKLLTKTGPGPVVQPKLVGGPAQRAVLQRTLAYDQPININDVQQVDRPSDAKEVYILSGTGSVVVKIESGSGAETKAETGARWSHGHWLAQMVLDNVPKARLLDPNDRAALAQLPNTMGQPAQDLRDSLAYYFSNPGFSQIAVKMETVNVGKNLKEMLEGTKTGKRGAGRMGGQVIDMLNNRPAIWTGLGKMAAFDLLMNNIDRFNADAKVNLENIDFTGGTDPQLTALDNFNPDQRSLLRKGTEWPGGRILKSKSATHDYCLRTCGYIADKAAGLTLIPDDWVENFEGGFKNAVADFKSIRKNLEIRILNSNDQETKDTGKVLIKRIKQI